MSKAKRISGQKFSRPKKMGILYIFLLILFVSVAKALFTNDYSGFLLGGIGFLMLLGSAALATKGSEQEIKYHDATFAKAPKIPYKKLAALSLAVTVFYLSFFVGGKDIWHSIFTTILAPIGFLLYYGFDPSVDKLPDADGISADMVIESIADAEKKLQEIENNIHDISDIPLYKKLENAIKKANNILDIIKDDPKDIRMARKFLVVYIDGLLNVTTSYTQLDDADIDYDTKDRLYSLMSDIDVRFDKEIKRLKENNQFDLDVHIDSLKEQI